MLDDETVERAKALGDGNLSMGVRKAVKEAVMGNRPAPGTRKESA